MKNNDNFRFSREIARLVFPTVLPEHEALAGETILDDYELRLLVEANWELEIKSPGQLDDYDAVALTTVKTLEPHKLAALRNRVLKRLMLCGCEEAR